MKKSVDAWNMSRKKLTDLPLPSNPFVAYQNEKPITWDKIDITKQQVPNCKNCKVQSVKNIKNI